MECLLHFGLIPTKSPGGTYRTAFSTWESIVGVKAFRLSVPTLYLEAEASHAAPVLLDGGLALLGRILRIGKEHALVPLGLFVFTYAAWLW